MRYITTAAFALAIGGLFAVSAAQAQDMTHSAGGPTQMGNNCWVSTSSDMGYGYWSPCAKPVRVAKRSKKK
jgi:hypothetical protein